MKPRFGVDRVTDVYWQEVHREYLKGNLIVSQEDLEYFSEEHPIAKALAERGKNPFDSQVQATLNASQEGIDGVDPSAAASPQGGSEGDSPESARRQQGTHESPIGIQRAQSTPVAQPEPATPVVGSSSGPRAVSYTHLTLPTKRIV